MRAAKSSYNGPVQFFNPVWKAVAPRFLSHMTARAGDESFTPELYVHERMLEGSITEAEVLEHAARGAKRLLVISGSPGVGKTTLLRRAFSDAPADLAVIWVEILTEFQQSLGAQVALTTLILEKLQEYVRPHARQWFEYFVANGPDASGAMTALGLELADTGNLSPSSLLLVGSTLDVMREKNPLGLIRTTCAFLRDKQQRRVVIVIDNCDQIETKRVVEVGEVAVQLAEGTRAPNATPNAITTMMAVRPSSLAVINKHGVSTFRIGVVMPPHLGKLLQLRFDAFMATSPTGLVAPSERDELKRYFDGHDPDEAVRKALDKSFDGLTKKGDREVEELCYVAFKLAAFNVRITLVALAGYIASAHLDWRVIAGTRRETGKPLTRRKKFHALLLGPRSFYEEDSSWVLNLFGDAQREGSVLTRIVVLSLLDNARAGIALDKLRAEVIAALGVTTEHVDAVWSKLTTKRMIEEVGEDGGYGLSEAGRALLALVDEFEYLQHVVVDVRMPEEFVLPLLNRGEVPSLRFVRVVRLLLWITKQRGFNHPTVGKIAERILTSLERVTDVLPDDRKMVEAQEDLAALRRTIAHRAG